MTYSDLSAKRHQITTVAPGRLDITPVEGIPEHEAERLIASNYDRMVNKYDYWNGSRQRGKLFDWLA